MRAVREAAVVPPRERDSSLSRALEAICLKALALRPEDRYPSARALAEDLREWLADEPVTAYTEPLTAPVRRWVRQHQRLVAGTAAATLVGVVGLVALITVVASSNRTVSQKNAEIRRQFQQLEVSNQKLVRRGPRRRTSETRPRPSPSSRFRASASRTRRRRAKRSRSRR